MGRFVAAALTVISLTATTTNGFSVGDVSRREMLQKAVIGGVAVAAPAAFQVLPANAVVDEETPRVVTRMGGLLVSSNFVTM
jgi:hypothetical protein